MSRLLRRALPVVVSVAALGFLLTRMDLAGVVAGVSPKRLGLLVPPLLVYGAVSLWLEAQSIFRLVPASHPVPGVGTCARMKAATYPLGMLHYALGGAALVVLLRRRTGLRVSDAAGVVMLIAALDLGVLLASTAVGASLLATEGPAVQAGLVVFAVVGLLLGILAVRSDFTLGPLERLRELDLFRAARETPARNLLLVLALRLAFVVSFIGLGATALLVFDVRPPLGNLVVNVAAIALVAVLPIAVAGLGTSQVAFVYFFGPWGTPENLLACSLALSAGLLLLRAGLGLAFAREFTREALQAVREAEA